MPWLEQRRDPRSQAGVQGNLQNEQGKSIAKLWVRQLAELRITVLDGKRSLTLHGDEFAVNRIRELAFVDFNAAVRAIAKWPDVYRSKSSLPLWRA